MGMDCLGGYSSILQAGWSILVPPQSCHAGRLHTLLREQHDRLKNTTKALFSASVILLVEKIFLQFVAISFHRKALADRLAENHLGLKALDRLSNAQLYVRKGHKSRPGSYDFLGFMGGHKSTHHDHVDHNADDRRESTIGSLDRGEEKPKKQGHGRKRSEYAERKQKRKKAMASIIVDQVGNAIGQVTLKNSKFNRDGEMGGLSSARKLARKLFGALSDVTPHKSRLVVEGKCFTHHKLDRSKTDCPP